jgi:hypothetical protein
MITQVINGIITLMLTSVANQEGSPLVIGLSSMGMREMAG